MHFWCFAGVTWTSLPINTATSEMTKVMAKARTGSPLPERVSNGLRKGIIWSLEMAWRRRGAPVKDWSPAPMVESKDPISTTLGWGQAMLPTTRLPPILSPNLQSNQTCKVRLFSFTIRFYDCISLGKIQRDRERIIVLHLGLFWAYFLYA